MKISGLPITTNGDYVFKVKIKESIGPSFKIVSELPLEIKINIESSSNLTN